MKSEIIYEDDNVIVCYKIAGMATEGTRSFQMDLVSELKNYIARNNKLNGKVGQPPYLAVIHRLDQPVEGLLVFAKDKKSAAVLSREVQTGKLKKSYLCVVCGKPEGKGHLKDLLTKDSNGLAKVVVDNDKTAKKAELKFETLESREIEGGIISLLKVELMTGRFHQIRVQMSHAGYPLLGDQKYGTDVSQKVSSDLKVQNVALCADRIAFNHPVTGRASEYNIIPRADIFGLFTSFNDKGEQH